MGSATFHPWMKDFYTARFLQEVYSHTVLLRTDGQAVACGYNSYGQGNIPPLDEGLLYSQVSAGNSHTVLLRSDGQV